MDLTAHFEKKMMDRIYEKITCEDIDMQDFIPMNPMEQSTVSNYTESSDANFTQHTPSPIAP